MRIRTTIAMASAAMLCPLVAGPYSGPLDDPLNPYDAPVPGFVGPHGIGKARLLGYDPDFNLVFQNPGNYVNPLFFAWAEEVVDYSPTEFSVGFSDETEALGPVTGDNFLVVSLGDLSAEDIAADTPPGSITLRLARPVRDLSGADFVVFENGHIAQYYAGGAGVGSIFAELAYIEVSDDGENFVRFPSTSLNPPLAELPGYGTQYASLDASKVHNLAGKHVNGYGDSWGTPFDLADVGLSQITHIRLVDIPGNGAFMDSQDGAIYDPWKTLGSSGFDLEAIGAVSAMMTYDEWPQLETLDPAARGRMLDADGDGIENLLEYAFGRVPGIADGPANLPVCRMVDVGGVPHAAIEFVRDERLADLVYEVQTTDSLMPGNWTTIARSVAGAPLAPVAGQQPVIDEVSASSIASIGVLRKVTVREAQPASGQRFFRVKVSTLPAP
jgi:hypothetical protein